MDHHALMLLLQQMENKVAKHSSRFSRIIMVALLFSAVIWVASNEFEYHFVAATLADDDDDSDGDSDDDSQGSQSNGSSGSAGSRDTSPATGIGRPGKSTEGQTRLRSQPRATAVVPTRAQNELIAAGLGGAAIQALVAQGYIIAERQMLTITQTEIVRFSTPPGVNLDAARARIEQEDPQALVDFNHYYLPEVEESQEGCSAQSCDLVRDMINWPKPLSSSLSPCGRATKIGLIDTAINPDHPAFRDANIEVLRIGNDALPRSGRQHGTAVAALLVGGSESRAPGLIPAAQLIAVDAFRKFSGSTDLASAFDLVAALDNLGTREVRVINMSLAGPENSVLGQMVAELVRRDIILVAAVGNAGPRAAPLFPAAYEGVIAVTAIDKMKRPFRRANQGPHVDFAAPGVDVWTAASVSGAKPKSGTSFAAPFVSAAAATLSAQKPDMSSAEITHMLASTSLDLGSSGKDPVFGWGLIDASTLCRARVTAEP